MNDNNRLKALSNESDVLDNRFEMTICETCEAISELTDDDIIEKMLDYIEMKAKHMNDRLVQYKKCQLSEEQLEQLIELAEDKGYEWHHKAMRERYIGKSEIKEDEYEERARKYFDIIEVLKQQVVCLADTGNNSVALGTQDVKVTGIIEKKEKAYRKEENYELDLQDIKFIQSIIRTFYHANEDDFRRSPSYMKLERQKMYLDKLYVNRQYREELDAGYLDKIRSRFEEVKTSSELDKYEKNLKYGEMMTTLELHYGIPLLEEFVNENTDKDALSLYREISSARNFSE